VADHGRKIELFFTWLERGNTVVTIFISLGIGKLLQTILSARSKIPEGYSTAVWLLASGLVMAIVIYVAGILRRRQPKITQAISAEASGARLDIIDQFYKAHDGPLMEEFEAAIRKYVEKYKSGQEKDSFFVRSLATVIIVAFFDETWNVIFGSQILVLEHLNKTMAKMEDLYPYYQKELDKRPQYSFESWFGFLKNSVLITQDGYNIGITVRGKEFLKYLVNFGRTAKDRPF
jgi:hypothetical protein